MNFLYSQENIKSILVVRLTSIGDVLLTTPLIRILRNLYPNTRIDFLTTKQMIDIFRFNPYIDNLYTVERSANTSKLINKKREFFTNRQYDVVIDLQNNLKSKILIKNVAHHIFKFDKRRLYKLKLVYLKYKPEIFPLIPDLYIKTAKDLGVEPDGKGLEFWLNNQQDKKFYKYGIKKQSDTSNNITIAPGAFHYTKTYPKEKFKELIEILLNGNFNITLIGGDSDKETGFYLEQHFKNKIQNHIGELSLAESAAVIDNSVLVISNDTAVMHIASARQTPVIALFGSTVREFGFLPYHSKYKIIEKQVPCRPCTHFGKSKCPKGHLNCLNSISPEEINAAVTEILD